MFEVFECNCQVRYLKVNGVEKTRYDGLTSTKRDSALMFSGFTPDGQDCSSGMCITKYKSCNVIHTLLLMR